MHLQHKINPNGSVCMMELNPGLHIGKVHAHLLGYTPSSRMFSSVIKNIEQLGTLEKGVTWGVYDLEMKKNYVCL